VCEAALAFQLAQIVNGMLLFRSEHIAGNKAGLVSASEPFANRR
jgi:hypothetical protein